MYEFYIVVPGYLTPDYKMYVFVEWSALRVYFFYMHSFLTTLHHQYSWGAHGPKMSYRTFCRKMIVSALRATKQIRDLVRCNLLTNVY